MSRRIGGQVRTTVQRLCDATLCHLLDLQVPGEVDGSCSALGLAVGSVSTTADVRSVPHTLAEIFNGAGQRLTVRVSGGAERMHLQLSSSEPQPCVCYLHALLHATMASTTSCTHPTCTSGWEKWSKTIPFIHFGGNG
eukprot:360282-Chlamydomonas_euryale.AAC.5